MVVGSWDLCVGTCPGAASREGRRTGRDVSRGRRPHCSRACCSRLIRGRPLPSCWCRCSGVRSDDWQAAGQRLAEANITALAIDLPSVTLPADPQSLAAWHHDIRAAVAFLADRPADVRAGAIGIAGASLGANLAAVAAAADPSVRSIALISPSLDYRGLRIEEPMRSVWRAAGAAHGQPPGSLRREVGPRAGAGRRGSARAAMVDDSRARHRCCCSAMSTWCGPWSSGSS